MEKALLDPASLTPWARSSLVPITNMGIDEPANCSGSNLQSNQCSFSAGCVCVVHLKVVFNESFWCLLSLAAFAIFIEYLCQPLAKILLWFPIGQIMDQDQTCGKTE